MDAILIEGPDRSPVKIVGVLYGRRVKVRFSSGGTVVAPASMLELTPAVTSELEAWFTMDGPGRWTADQYNVLEHLARVGGRRGLLDTEYPWRQAQVVAARRVLRQRGLVDHADPKQGDDDDGRLVRWVLTNQGIAELAVARRLIRAVGEGHEVAAVGTG